MQNDANVVHLTRVASEPSPNAGAGRLPVILVQVRDKAALQLKQALQALFDNADDTLFEMADRATSNLEQNAFFEAMRDLRLKRKSIERVYLQKVFEEFSALHQVQTGKSVPTLDTVSFDSLSLVQNEELEESVAVDAMVARVMSRDASALAHLSTRLNTLVGRKVDEKSNPLAPRPLTAAFLDACQGLGVEIKVKLIILKLFEKYVLAHCDQLYAEANQILVAAGVLPELKSALPRRQPAVRPEAVRDAGTLQAQAALLDGGQQEVFGALQELLAQVRDNPSFYRRETPENAAPISSNDLMRLLSHLQQHLPGPGAAEFDVRDGVDQLLQRVSHKSGRSRVVGQVDDDVINLVSMLFEFILDDRTLPDSLKALIGRMQIPMLKVALLDKTFFSRGSHPARRLLNEIASASLGWAEHNDARRDSLYQKIEQVVMRLLNDFVDDPAIFAELLEDFIAFTGDERRRSELLEQRTRDAEEGRAKAELARQDVEQVLNQRLLGKVLPEVVVRLLRDAWSKVMLLICLKHGKASAEWREALDTMDELIWSVGPHDDPLSRQQLLERVPGLLKALREEAQAAFHVAERDLGILGGSESELIGRVHGHLLWQGYQSFFAVIFWYALLGPVAALAYRLLALALEHARQPALREQAARVRHILDWLPVRALVLSFALVGNFLAVIRVLLHWLLAWDISAAALLGKAGRVASDVEAVELGAAGVASLDALWQLLVRAAVLWYAVFAFCALFL
ncbi:regulatory signaling modulator protein AmpE [Pseudomonas aeruginosa]|nr:regulatory signaling modulator protein AmpE [Pseudomonas aeruginosa]